VCTQLSIYLFYLSTTNTTRQAMHHQPVWEWRSEDEKWENGGMDGRMGVSFCSVLKATDTMNSVPGKKLLLMSRDVVVLSSCM